MHPRPIPEEMDGLIDYLFVRSLFLGIRPSKHIKKSDIKILVYTPILYAYTNCDSLTMMWPVENPDFIP